MPVCNFVGSCYILYTAWHHIPAHHNMSFFYFLFQFPVLKTIASRIVQVFLLFSVGNHSSTQEVESELDKGSCEGSVPDVGTPGFGRRLTSTRYQ